MPYAVRGYLTVLVIVVFAFGAVGERALAGTTGSLSGRAYDSASGAPIAGAKVTAVAPSESVSTTTDANGSFSFLSLTPDTYTLTGVKDGYDTTTQRGITVLADQNQSVSIALVRSVATLGKIIVRSTADLIKAGTTSDVYSINASTVAAANALGGPGNLNQAYGAMVTVPGVNMPQAQQGWYQTVYIRGGDQDQVGWEFDGIPVNRAYDNAPMTFLSNLGQQELQVYTGGTLATSDASSISGYVNQVIKKGTFPGYGDLTLAIGFPTFYNKGSIEIGGATPDQRFTYYAGTVLDDSGYRYINQNNGAGTPGYFYPLDCCGTSSGIYDGGGSSFFFASPGQSYAIAVTKDRESIANLHWAIPHGNQKDDVQLLGLASELWAGYNSSVNDLGGPNLVYNTPDSFNPISWQNGMIYSGSIFAPVNTSFEKVYLYPSGPRNSAGSPSTCLLPSGFPQCEGIPVDNRDVNRNGVYIYKLQYQHNFSDKAYLRLFGYTTYSSWFIDGPLSNFLVFGAEISDYENIFHQHGVTAQYANQLTDQHLLTVSAFWNHGHGERYSATGAFPGCTVDCFGSGGQASFYTNLLDSAGNCYNDAGNIDDCFNKINRGRFIGLCINPPANTECGAMPYPATGAAARAGALWTVTSAGYHANLNKVDPTFAAVALNDNWKPNNRWTFNIGLRVENYKAAFPDVSVGYPARAFWFKAYNDEFCFGPGRLAPVLKDNPTNVPYSTLPCTAPLTTAVNLTNPPGGGSFSHTVFQPRFGFTAEAGANDVFRGSAGVYARPASTREASWNTVEQNLPFVLGSDFLQYGFTTPEHDVRPDRSTNFDLSWEHHFPGSQVSFKLTPFYRSTQDQLQQLIVNALTGLFASFNAGRQVSDGVEVAVNGGDFARNGFSGKLSFTYTRSRVRYENFANGRNVIDNLNTYVQQYNSFTSSCASASPNASGPCGVNGNSNALPVFPCTSPCLGGVVANPYFNAPQQPLFDRNAWYTTYDLIPAPFAAANGFETPAVGSWLINYKHDKWNFTPSLVYSSGAKYGSPVSWPGYDPSSCGNHVVSNTTADTSTCSSNIFIPDFYTGKFDNLGDFNEPSRFTVNMQIGYESTPRVKYTLTMTNLLDRCFQRGYKWDYQHICVYSSLPSSVLPPVGNFTDPAGLTGQAVDLKYPYAVWLNNNNTGFVGTELPFQASFEVHLKL